MSTDVLLDLYQIDSVLSQRPGKRSLQAQDRRNGHAVFIREYDLRDPVNLDRLERFKRQAALLKQMNHPRIPALLDWVQTEDHLFLISQFVPGQTLASRMASGWKPQEKDSIAIAEQLLQILSYLQSYNLPMLSFALRPGQLRVDALDRVWLADFGGLQPVNELQELAASLIHLLTGRELEQLPRLKDKPAFHSFVSISNEFSRWLEDLLESSPKHRADQALESLWKLQGKTWQTPLEVKRPRKLAPEVRPNDGPWPLGSLLADNYSLRQVLGKGLGSWKYAGWDTALKQDVTLKLQPLPVHLTQHPAELDSYLDRARQLQSLHHPQIPRFLRAFVTEQDGQPYLALTHVLVSGETLKDKFEAGWRPKAAELWDLTRQLLKLLEFAQTRHQAHGHLNPSNLVVNKFGRVWLIDFGLFEAEPAQDLYDLAASLIFLLSGAQPGEFLAGSLQLRFADDKPFPPQLASWLKRMLQAEPGQALGSATDALKAFDQALLAAQPPKLIETPPLIQVVSARKSLKSPVKNSALPWETGVEQLRAQGLQSRLLQGGGIELHCPESKELTQWNRSKTIGMLASPLRMFEEFQEKSRQQKSKFFPLSGHRLEISPDDIRLLKGGSASGEQEILAIYWYQLLQARLTPAPPKLLEALKNKVMPPAGTNFRLFHLLLTKQAQNAHCLIYLPPKAIPPLTQLIHQQLAGSI
jgi:serine/threonine protein kinase